MILLPQRKNHFKQRLPGWADFQRTEFDFMGQKELLAHDILKRWESDNDFHRFSISTSDSPYAHKYTLMVELEEGRKWWVVGYIDHVEGIDLPEWVPVK